MGDTGAMLVATILSLALTGLVVGALGRLAIPGPNPMTIGMTILVGLGGAFLGGLVGGLVFGNRAPMFLLAVLGAALLVWLLQRRPARPVR